MSSLRHRRTVRLTSVLLLTTLGAACQDAPTLPAPVHRAPAVPALNQGQHLGEVPFTCTVGRHAPSAPNGWETRRVTIFIARGHLDDAGRVVRYGYQRSFADGRPLGSASCVVPYTEGALRSVDRYFGVEAGGGGDQFRARQDMVTTQGCVTDGGGCLLDPVVVIAPPPPPADLPPCSGCDAPFPGGSGGGGGGGGGGAGGTAGTAGTAGETYDQGPWVWAGCVLLMAGSSYSVWQVADKFETWHAAYKDAEGAYGLWQATVQNNADVYTQQLYEYQYKQARQRQEDAKGAVQDATGTSALALASAAVTCGALMLLPTP